MDGLSHVVLHVTLCSAALKAPPDKPVAIHLAMSYEHGDPFLDKTFSVTRGSANDATLEVDVTQGQERVRLEAPQYRCSGGDIVQILTDRNRKIDETLVDEPDTRPQPTFIFSGTAPLSFLYTTKPTFVALEKSVACDAPVQKPIPLTLMHAVYDQGAYYLSMPPDPSLAPLAPVFALRLMTPTGLAHYIRLPIDPPPLGGWPEIITMPVTEDMVDDVATQKPETLLCLKLWRSSVR